MMFKMIGIYCVVLAMGMVTSDSKYPSQKNKCDKSCYWIWMPVCGTDGKTYGNACALDVASCMDPTIALDYRGKCRDKPLDKKDCPNWCHRNYAPMCGTDGKTYGNDCELKAASCNDPTITLEYTGQCIPEICRQPRKKGPCRALLPSWYYNQEKRKCVRFAYGGCKGNGNRFPTRKTCERRCNQGDKPLDKKDCPIWCHKQYAPMCGTDGKTYGNDCELKAASCNDPTIALEYTGQCIPEICRQPRKKGPCRALLPSWYYNQEKRKCVRFAYGGCKGNGNRFPTRKTCERRCNQGMAVFRKLQLSGSNEETPSWEISKDGGDLLRQPIHKWLMNIVPS